MKLRKLYTNRDVGSVQAYLNEIGTFEVLPQEEEVILMRQIKEGNNDEKKSATDQLVEANLRFVVSVAKQFQNGGIPLNDLINEGNIGMIKAVGKFDETRGFKFISYAIWWIKQSILAALATDRRTVRLPLNRSTIIGKITKARKELEQELERPPTDTEIAEKIERNSDLSKKEVIYTLEHGSLSSSLDRPLFNKKNESSNIHQIDRIKSSEPPPDSGLIKESLKLEVEGILNELRPKEADIIRRCFGIGFPEPQSLEKIGKVMNITSERVRQLKEKALRDLRHKNKAESLKALLR